MKMLSWALGYYIVAILCAVIGFTGALPAIAGHCKVLFFIFLVLTLVALVAGSIENLERKS